MGRYDDDWYDAEYERMCQEAEVADDEEGARLRDWIFWTPIKVALIEFPAVMLLAVLLALAHVDVCWSMGFIVAPLIAFAYWCLRLTYNIHNYGKGIVWRRFWQYHLLFLVVVVPLFGFKAAVLFLFLCVVGYFLKLMLGR